MDFDAYAYGRSTNLLSRANCQKHVLRIYALRRFWEIACGYEHLKIFGGIAAIGRYGSGRDDDESKLA